jgi:hypothetical protein
MDGSWKHIATVVDGQRFQIDGVEIWNHKWLQTAEKVFVKDPLYGQDYTFNVYQISSGNMTIEFAAGEFSNCVWGIFQKK